MTPQAPESRMHLIRWVLTAAWLLIIASLFHDPWTPRLTEPGHPWSPLRLPQDCIAVQGVCLEEQPYPLGTTIFWGAVVPSAVFLLLVFGHELWRRICPLSFLSQIPRALGLQRQITRKNPRTGEERRQLARVPSESWLGRHYPAIQFGWLFVGLCGRILFFNADRLVLAAWLLGTIAAAVLVGWLWGGKSWCQYFCPMAPVQAVYSTPAGLLGSQAHTSEQRITQSMCRTVLPDGSEQSACVACQQPCIDIDAERLYWTRLPQRDFAVERYGYVGLVVGYFLYYYLYAGNWDYYFSGAWARQSDQLAQLWSPGLVLFGQAIAVPRLVAVPLVLGGFTLLGIAVGRSVERWLRRRQRGRRQPLSNDLVRHRVFAVATFLVFNFFFLFSGRPLLLLLPTWVQTLFDVLVVSLSTLWLVRTWQRSPQLYERENLAGRFRRQLERLELDVGRYLEGRSLADLSSHEVYVLAKVLPGFDRQKRQNAYKEVVREALEEGYVNVASSLDVLRQMRRELDISDDEHRHVLQELGVEDPALLDPDRRRSLEEQIRLTGYRRSLERLMRLQSRGADPAAMGALRQEFAISAAEEERIRAGLSPTAGAAQRSEALLQRLPELLDTLGALQGSAEPLGRLAALRDLLRERLRQRVDLTVRGILGACAEMVDAADPALPQRLAALRSLAPPGLAEALAEGPWRDRLSPELLAPPADPSPESAPAGPAGPALEALVQDLDPLVRAAAVVLLARFDRDRAQELAEALRGESGAPLAAATAGRLLELAGAEPRLADFPELEKRVVLEQSDFFRGTHGDTLNALADAAELRRFDRGGVITEAGDTCRELLLIIEGEASVRYSGGDDPAHRQGDREPLRPGRMLDELEVLSHGTSENTVVADTDGTRLLAVPVDSFDAMLDRDSDFSRRVLELESRQLRRFMKAVGS